MSLLRKAEDAPKLKPSKLTLRNTPWRNHYTCSSGDLYNNVFGVLPNKTKDKFPTIVDWISKLCNSIFSKTEQLNISTWMNLKNTIQGLFFFFFEPKKASHRKTHSV